MSDARDLTVNYISKLFAQEDFVLNNILADQEEGGGPMMNIGPDQGKFLYLLMKLLKPSKVLEIGSYYGYSSMWMARGITDGELHCVEVSSAQVDYIANLMTQEGMDHVHVHQGAGIEMMTKFKSEALSFDVIFVDADKASYSEYLDLAYDLLPSGGLLLVDNCIWDGRVPQYDAGEFEGDKSTKAIAAFNKKLAEHGGFESTIVTVQDGMSFAIKN